jgi:hypothetical protein
MASVIVLEELYAILLNSKHYMDNQINWASTVQTKMPVIPYLPSLCFLKIKVEKMFTSVFVFSSPTCEFCWMGHN